MFKEEVSSGFLIGIEREALRCTAEGKLCLTRHPEEFGNKMKNCFITTDFGEAQIELRTPPCPSPEDCYERLSELTNTVLTVLNHKKEYLWCYSMPCDLPELDRFLFNDYTGYPEEAEYEKYLAEKYGISVMCISGVHFNFSVSDELIIKMHDLYPEIPMNKDDAYFRCMRGFYRCENLFRYFFDASPTDLDGNIINGDSYRNSSSGYRNGMEKELSFNSKAEYIKDLKKLHDQHRLARPSELYIPIRPKSRADIPLLEGLEQETIDHIEVRLCDIDPFDICGISEESIRFSTMFLFCCMVMGDDVPQEISAFFEKCREIDMALRLGLYKDKYTARTADRIRQILSQNENGLLELSIEYSRIASEYFYFLPRYPLLEPSTSILICDALMLGIDYRIINETKCIVEFIGNGRKEIIVQATRTRLDSDIFEQITDDKVYTNEVFRKAGISIPETVVISSDDFINKKEDCIKLVCGGSSVIKPRSTNFGTGITVFESTPSTEDAVKALKTAFSYDNSVLVQKYVCGDEYRFFIINGKCRSVILRHPANVTGDGVHTISELVAEKLKTPRFRSMEKKIVIDCTSMTLLSEKGMSLDSVPKAGEVVYLQKASNASLGGESENVTDIVPEHFKLKAEEAAKLFDAFICGVDIIIPSLDDTKYSVLEINENPGMYISEVPVIGRECRLGQEILKLLELC